MNVKHSYSKKGSHLSLSVRGLAGLPLPHYALFILCFLSAVILGSIHAEAATLAFNDANWNWVDHDGRSGTTYTATSNQLTVEASGDNVWTRDDEFAARYLDNVNGDFEISVRIIRFFAPDAAITSDLVSLATIRAINILTKTPVFRTLRTIIFPLMQIKRLV